MDVKRFKTNLENSIGKRLEKLQKEFESSNLDLQNLKNSIRDLTNFIEEKNTKNRPMMARHRKSKTPNIPNFFPILKPEDPKKYTPDITISDQLDPPKPKFNITKRLRKVFKPRQTLDQVLSQIKDLEQHYPVNNLNSKADFSISLGANSAFDIIKGMHEDAFRLSNNPDKKILWAFGLFLQLLGEEFDPEGENARNRVQELLTCCVSSGNIKEFFMTAIKSFDFDNENINAIEEYIDGKNEMIAPQMYTNVSQLCGLLMVSLREAVVFCGFISEKAPKWRVYQRLLYKKKVLENS